MPPSNGTITPKHFMVGTGVLMLLGQQVGRFFLNGEVAMVTFFEVWFVMAIVSVGFEIFGGWEP